MVVSIGRFNVTSDYRHSIREKYWWPCKTEDVDQFVGSCNICQQAKDPKNFKKDEELFHLWTTLFTFYCWKEKQEGAQICAGNDRCF